MHAYAPNPNPDRAVQDLGRVFELMNTAVKPYPSCRYGHAGIDAALALRAPMNQGRTKSPRSHWACREPA